MNRPAGAGLQVDPLERLLRGEHPDGARVVSERILRRVLRVELGDGRVVFAKQHLFPFLRVRLRYALRASPTQREAKLLRQVAELGLCVPRVLGERSVRGLLGPRLAVLVTESLEPRHPLAPADRLRAVLAIAERGVWHPDLHEDNVFAIGDSDSGIEARTGAATHNAGQWAYLDFQSCRIRGSAIRGRALAEMLAPCAVEIVTERGRPGLEALLSESGVIESLAAAGTSVNAVVERTFDRMRRSSASRRRHRLRSSSSILREPGGRLLTRGVELPSVFGPEEELELERWGALRVAVSTDSRVARLRGRLREAWALADPDFGQESAFLAWEPETVWWKGRGSLYIALPDNGLPSLPCFRARQDSV